MANEGVSVVLVTAPDAETGARLAEAMVDEGLAACVSIVPGVTSIYRWKGEIHRDPEHLLIMKVPTGAFGQARNRIAELHPYETPEILAFDVDDGAPEYLRWVLETTGGGA